ncbi:hypothetical protein HanRHA438_Chr15g0689711 [Helianthus annuus]|nr:hypothetical protein HanRHA438_Chr15g0689711 [Helianthus annuus]
MQVQKLDLLENALSRATRRGHMGMARHAGPPAARDGSNHVWRVARQTNNRIFFYFCYVM